MNIRKDSQRLSLWLESRAELEEYVSTLIELCGLDREHPLTSEQQSERLPGVFDVLEEVPRKAIASGLGVSGSMVSQWASGATIITTSRIVDVFSLLFTKAGCEQDKDDAVWSALNGLFPVPNDRLLEVERTRARTCITAIAKLLRDDSLASLLDVAVALRKNDVLRSGAGPAYASVMPSFHLRQYHENDRRECMLSAIESLPD